MNKKNKQYHFDNISSYSLHKLGFRYSSLYECYVFIFPVFFYKKTPIIFCRLRLYKLDNIIEYDIIKTNKEPLAVYYDKSFGNADSYIKKIDYKIYKRLKTMKFINM